jgi:ABC-2 type transport system ATP-binding protein
MIIIESLNKSFGKKAVLKNINIVFEKGKTYGIVGENGSGKTSLFKCIAGLESYEGVIRSEFDKLKNHLGCFVTQEKLI